MLTHVALLVTRYTEQVMKRDWFVKQICNNMLKNYTGLILFYIVLSDQNTIVLYIIYGGTLHSQNECKITRIFNHRGYTYIHYNIIYDNSKT